jgi:hypothetical protein
MWKLSNNFVFHLHTSVNYKKVCEGIKGPKHNYAYVLCQEITDVTGCCVGNVPEIVVSMLASVPEFAGSNPAKPSDFLYGKIHSMPSFGGEVK